MSNNINEKTPVYKRVLALAGIVILVGMYVVLLVQALTGSPETYSTFITCLAATIAIPIVLWLLIWSIGALTGRHTIASLDAMTSNKRHDKFGNVIPDEDDKKDKVDDDTVSDTAIDTIVFDIGNVLVNFVWDDFLRNKGYDEEMVQRMGKASVFSKDWVQFDIGNLTTQEIAELFAENDPEIGDELKKAFTDLTDIVTERDRTIPWIHALKKEGYRILYLSNFSIQALEGSPEVMKFLDETDGGILSYRDHVVKPGKEIYRLLEERFDLTPAKTVFIDDTPANIETAINIGWHGIVYKDYEQVEKELKDLGVNYKM